MNDYLSVSEAYLATVRKVWQEPDNLSAPRGLPVRELIDYSFRVLNPRHGPIVTGWPERDKVMLDYLRKEQALYRTGELLATEWGRKASPFWTKLANPDGTINSNYGYLLRLCPSHGNQTMEKAYGKIANPSRYTPWFWAAQSLLHDRDSRQAFSRISLPSHQWFGNKDQPCTMHLHFRILNLNGVDKLCLTVVMRSNDITKGLPYDMPYFVSLLRQMVWELQTGGRLVTDGSFRSMPDLKVGWYRHFAHSMHGYSSDAATIEKIIKASERKENGHEVATG